jgi:hypothetical protein
MEECFFFFFDLNRRHLFIASSQGTDATITNVHDYTGTKYYAPSNMVSLVAKAINQ